MILKSKKPKEPKPKKSWRARYQGLRYKPRQQYQQQSSVPTSKVVAQTIAGSLTTVIVAAVAFVFGVELDDTAQVTLTLFLAGLVQVALTFIASYLTRPREGDGIEKKP